MLSQQLNDLLCKAFTVDVNGNIAIRMTVQSGNTQYWKDPVATFANLPSSGNTLGDIRMTLDDGVIYRWDGTTWLSGASVGAGQGLSLSGSTLSVSLDTNSGLQFISGKLAVKPDGTTLESVAGTLRVKPGVFASSTHTHTSADITDWTTALNTWLATKSTTNLAEGTNLYYTQARFDSAFTAKSTTNLAEGTNLYYTDARVISAITGGASSISNVNLTINRALISDASGKVAVSSVTNTELGYLSGVTSAIQTQINGKQASLGYTAENTANKGAVNGYASLDGTGKVPSSQLPSFVDDVLEYANLASFPATGSTGIIYVALDTNKIYRWSGSAYVEISGSPGSTDAVPEGSTNLYFTTARVLATALTGLSLATGTAITASDTILSAMGKLQKQITDEISARTSGDSTLTTALAGKEPTITAGTTLQYWRGDKSWQTLDKTAVGLGNVDNTSDATKNSATATLANKTLTKPTINGSVQGVTVDTDGATVTFDMASSNQHQVTIGGNRTFAVSNVSIGQYFSIDIIQDATGSRTVTWFGTIKWAGGTAPTLTTTGGKKDKIVFYCESSGVYQGFVAGKNI